MPTVLFYEQRDGEGDLAGPLPLPVFWAVGLSDRLTLDGAVLPVGLRYQVHRSERHVFGVAGGLRGLSVSEGSTTVGVGMGAYERFIVAGWLALEGSAELIQFVRRDAPDDRIGLASAGPLIQVLPSLALRAAAAVDASEAGSGMALRPTGSASVTWSFHRRWDLSAGYDATRLDPAWHQHGAHVTVLLYW